MQGCISNNECIKQRIAYTNCVYKYQASTWLCKVQKRELTDCFGHFAKTYNMLLSDDGLF